MGIQIQRIIPFLRRHDVEPTILTSTQPGRPLSELGVSGERIFRTLSCGDSALTRARRVLQFRRHFSQHGTAYDLLHTVMGNWEFLLNAPYFKARGQ